MHKYKYIYISYIDLTYIVKVVILLYTFREHVEGKTHIFCQRSSFQKDIPSRLNAIIGKINSMSTCI